MEPSRTGGTGHCRDTGTQGHRDTGVTERSMQKSESNCKVSVTGSNNGLNVTITVWRNIRDE